MNYKLKGNPVIENIPVIGNLIYDDLGKEVIAKFNEKFKSVRNIEYQNKFKKNEIISYSNIPRALGINNILKEITKGEIKLLSPEEVVRYWNSIPERDSTYADTDSVLLYPNKGPNEDLRQKVLKLTGKKSKLPLIVSGLDVEKADSDYGFTFVGTDYMKATEAPFLTSDGKIIYNPKEDKLESSDKGVSVWTSDNQSGLRRLYRSRNDNLDAGDGNMLNSGDYGRVQIISGVAASPNLEVYIKQFKLEENKTKEKLKKIKQAQAILKGE